MPAQSPPDRYSITPLRRADSGDYSCRVIKGSRALIRFFTITVVDPLVVTLDGSGSRTAGESYTLSCTAIGGEDVIRSYQWDKDGTLLASRSPPGMFSLSPLKQVDTGGYTCTVTRGSMVVTSNAVNVTVEG